MAIREKAGVITKKIEGNPLDQEKIEASQKEETPPAKKNQLNSHYQLSKGAVTGAFFPLRLQTSFKKTVF